MEGRLKPRVPSNWGQTILVCAKCSKKLKGGFGARERTPLAKALRKHLQTGKGRMADAGILEVGCLGLCPKRGVTVVDARHPDQWLVVRPGANLDGLAHELDLKG